LVLVGAVVALAGIVGQLNELDGHGHWLLVEKTLGNPFWLAATALTLWAAAVVFGMQRYAWWRIAGRVTAAVLLLLLAAGCAFLGYLDHTWYGWRQVKRIEAPGSQTLRVIVEEDANPATYWKVDVESGHWLSRRRWEAACSLSSSGGDSLTDVTWTGPHQVRVTTGENGSLTLTVDRVGRPASPVAADFAC
jgi:hypothetical protein